MGDLLVDGQQGDMVCMCLYKDDIYLIICFNMYDVIKVKMGLLFLNVNFKCIEGFFG